MLPARGPLTALSRLSLLSCLLGIFPFWKEWRVTHPGLKLPSLSGPLPRSFVSSAFPFLRACLYADSVSMRP